ncbi:MAG: response regulator [Alphaproteobacteria bacterium]|nr:response regulator [Alphaproteobacteria bacterium]
MGENITSNGTNTKILLVSDNRADVGNIKLRLEESIDFPCYIWHCQTLAEALAYLDEKKLRADLVILDLGLISTANPKEIYKKMGDAAQSIPIIVLTGAGKEEHDLATFVMEAGASDHMVRGQFTRIADAIEFSLIRHKITAATSKQNLHYHDHERMKAKGDSDKRNGEKKQYISWIMGGYSVENNEEEER